MKKLILSIVIAVASSTTVSAQLLPTFQLGVKGALNFSSLKKEGQWLDKSTRTGYQAGIWARVGGAGVHFQPELYFTGKSTEAEFEESGGNTATAKVTFTSLDLPLLLGTRIGIGPVGFRIQAGPVVSFVVDKGLGDALGRVTDIDDYKNAAWAVTGGIGIDFSKLRADLRYEHGLSDLSKDNLYPQKLGLWSLGVGYRLF